MCILKLVIVHSKNMIIVMINIFQTDMSGQTVQTQIRLLLEAGQTVQIQIRLLLEEQSDQGLHCLLFHLHLFDEIPSGLASFLGF